jgi:hypothetical protein
MAKNTDKIVKANRGGVVMFINITKMSDSENIQSGDVIKVLDWPYKSINLKPNFKKAVIKKNMILEEYDKAEFIKKYPYLFI